MANSDLFPPQHMDKYSRNERLYKHLLGMGLVVTPFPASDHPERIEYMYVSTVLPDAAAIDKGSQKATVTGVREAVKRPQVEDIVGTTKRGGDGVVIDLPPIRR